MKIVLTIISLIIISSVSGQTTYVGQSSNTWYVNPPTSGCNGIWAIDINLWPCGAGCTYLSASPSGCLASTFPACDSIIGDTLYLKLCSLPCNINATCISGSTAICNTGTLITTQLNEKIIEPEILNVYPTPSKSTIFFEFNLLQIENVLIEIKNIYGQSVKIIDKGMYTYGRNKIEIDIHEFSSGLYFLQLQSGNKIMRKKIIKE